MGVRGAVNLLLITPEDLVESDVAEIGGRRFRHVTEVLKLQERSGCCRAGMLGGRTGTAELLSADSEAERMRLRLHWTAEPPPPLPAILVTALPRPKTFRKVLHAAVTLGVKHLIFIHAFKVDRSYWSSPVIEEKNLREELLPALEQAGDTVLPKVEFRTRFKPFVEDEFPALCIGRRALVAHPGAVEGCTPSTEPLTLCIGPEGGFTEYEVELLCANGARAVTLGPRILRTEVAVPVLLARLFL